MVTEEKMLKAGVHTNFRKEHRDPPNSKRADPGAPGEKRKRFRHSDGLP